EAGIRCVHVTGVQTCALPISPDVEHDGRRLARERHGQRLRADEHALAARGVEVLARLADERRAGHATTPVSVAVPWSGASGSSDGAVAPSSSRMVYASTSSGW